MMYLFFDTRLSIINHVDVVVSLRFRSFSCLPPSHLDSTVTTVPLQQMNTSHIEELSENPCSS